MLERSALEKTLAAEEELKNENKLEPQKIKQPWAEAGEAALFGRGRKAGIRELARGELGRPVGGRGNQFTAGRIQSRMGSGWPEGSQPRRLEAEESVCQSTAC